jgi:tetratricopeptide (TPR) repeat protein
MTTPPRVLHLAEAEPFQDGAVPWIPLRRALGVAAFGINAYRNDAGGQVIEEHDEVGAGAARHEEVYVVLEGRASFTVDGEAIDAPAGTVVFVPDPASRRGAVAEAAGTTVLVVGGVPGEPYRPAPWEASLHAALLARRGDEEAARRAIADALADHGDNPRSLYNVACAEALLGDRDAALEHLAAAAADAPEAREWAQRDEDLESLRGDPRFPAPPG